jgi:hypothetical protein
MMRLLCRGSWVCPHLASSDQETLLFNTVRLLSCCGVFRGNYCVAAKAWVGIWESLVAYTTVVAFVWGFHVIMSITPKRRIIIPGSENTDGIERGIGWAEDTAVWLISAGILVNLFSIMRFYANVAKGSYGSWDQLWSTPTLLLGYVAVGLPVFAFGRAAYVGNLRFATSVLTSGLSDEKSLDWKLRVGLLLFWLATYFMFAYLVVGYYDPYTRWLLDLLTRGPKGP